MLVLDSRAIAKKLRRKKKKQLGSSLVIDYEAAAASRARQEARNRPKERIKRQNHQTSCICGKLFGSAEAQQDHYRAKRCTGRVPAKLPSPKSEPQPKRQKKKRPDKAFYESDEWKQLRYRVLVKYGAQCQCCGRSRSDGVVIHVDHIKPRFYFPELELAFDNLQVLCADCNQGKRHLDQTDWR